MFYCIIGFSSIKFSSIKQLYSNNKETLPFLKLLDSLC